MEPLTIEHSSQVLKDTFSGEWTLIRASDCFVFTDGERVAKLERIPGRESQLRTGLLSAVRAVEANVPAVSPLENELVETSIGPISLWPMVKHNTPVPKEFDKAHALALGIALARCGQMTSDSAIRFNPWKEITQRVHESITDLPVTELVASVVKSAQKALEIPSEDSWVMAHGDASARNVLCLENGWLLLIDFDYSGIYPKNWDLACVRHQLLRSYYNEEGYEGVLAGWESVLGKVDSDDLDVLEFLAALLATVFALTLEPTESRVKGIISRSHDMLEWLQTGVPPRRMEQIV